MHKQSQQRVFQTNERTWSVFATSQKQIRALATIMIKTAVVKKIQLCTQPPITNVRLHIIRPLLLFNSSLDNVGVFTKTAETTETKHTEFELQNWRMLPGTEIPARPHEVVCSLAEC